MILPEGIVHNITKPKSGISTYFINPILNRVLGDVILNKRPKGLALS
jgi:hypothetical protein